MAGKRRGNGEGSIYFRASDEKWTGSLTLATGKRKVFYGATQEEVRRKLAKAVRDRDVGLHTQTDGRQSFGEYLNAWLDAMKTQVRESTWISYEHRLRLYIIPAVGKVRLVRLAPSDLSHVYTSLMKERGLSASTVLKTHGIVKHALSDALRAGLVPRNVADLLDAPKVHKRPMVTYTPEQVDKLLTAIEGHKHEALYTLALTSGMRLGELLALKWNDVDLVAGFLSVREGRTRKLTGWTDGAPARQIAADAVLGSPVTP
jgi:integrase